MTRTATGVYLIDPYFERFENQPIDALETILTKGGSISKTINTSAATIKHVDTIPAAFKQNEIELFTCNTKQQKKENNDCGLWAIANALHILASNGNTGELAQTVKQENINQLQRKLPFIDQHIKLNALPDTKDLMDMDALLETVGINSAKTYLPGLN